MRLIAVGDNVVDCYVDQGVYYPGGNAVNVAVGCRRAGCEQAAYLGVLGNDREADHLTDALSKEGITWDHCRRVYAITGHPGVKLVDGDRVFIGGPKNTAQHIVRLRLTDEDLAYISQFDICHTSCYSSIEPELEKIRKECDISFDFSSDCQRTEYLAQVCPHIRFAFFSGSELTDTEVDALIDSVHGYGPEIVGITLGSRGALFSRIGQRYRQSIIPVDSVVDTMGAGDSFIAGFLTRFGQGATMPEALSFAAERAAQTCKEPGAFGYGKEIE